MSVLPYTPSPLSASLSSVLAAPPSGLSGSEHPLFQPAPAPVCLSISEILQSAGGPLFIGSVSPLALSLTCPTRTHPSPPDVRLCHRVEVGGLGFTETWREEKKSRELTVPKEVTGGLGRVVPGWGRV